MDIAGCFTQQAVQAPAKDEGWELIHSKYSAIRALHCCAAGRIHQDGQVGVAASLLRSSSYWAAVSTRHFTLTELSQS